MYRLPVMLFEFEPVYFMVINVVCCCRHFFFFLV